MWADARAVLLCAHPYRPSARAVAFPLSPAVGEGVSPMSDAGLLRVVGASTGRGISDDAAAELATDTIVKVRSLFGEMRTISELIVAVWGDSENGESNSGGLVVVLS